MEDSRRLNPYAPPFYPSTFHHFHPPITDNKTKLSKTFLPYSSLTPVPTGPRIPGGRCTSRRRAARPAVVGRRSRDDDDDDGGGVRRRQVLWKRRGVYREIMPLDPHENSTSVMIRNIPNNYTRELLVEFLENHCKQENENDKNTVRSSFDFLYLPVDFKHRLNAGYAFVNFTSSDAAWRFHKSIKGKHWDLFQSKKIADVTRAKIQGKEALVKNFERMQLRSPSLEYLPVWFDPPRDGCSPPSSMMKMHTIGSANL